ncbi:MAG: flippase-like domain-containing protein [Veillonellaceae bacterium]|nr:flippase-like domain-containing protein [Veillonellaceae bacterium]
MNRLARNGIILFLLIAAVTFCTLYFTIDVSTWHALTYFSPFNLFVAVAIWGIGMYFDGLRLQRLVAMNGYRVRLRGIMQVIFGNYFMGLLTPGAAGGAIAQVLILRSIGVPIAKSGMIVIIRTIFSILFLILALPVVFFFDPMDMPYIGNSTLFYIAMAFLLCCIAGFWLFSGEQGKVFTFRLLRTLRVSPRRIRKAVGIMRGLTDTLQTLREQPREAFLVFVYSGLSLCCIYGLLPALVWGSGEAANWLFLLGRMIVLNFMLYFAPTPGGTGIAEGFFVILFKGYVPKGTVGILAVLWRMIAEYLPFFLGMYFILTLFGKKYLLGKQTEETSDRSE